jgi:type I restriction enzyme, S subunit
MSTWKKVRLGELCRVISGGTPSRSELGYYGGGIPWVKIGDMLQGRILDTEETITDAGLKNSSAKILPAGTVLISIFATIGRTATLGVDATTNQAIAGLVPYDPNILISDYLRRFLDYAVQTLQKEARGVAQVNINSKILKEIEIPLPPVAMQEKILTILDQADALLVKRRQSIALLGELTQAIFLGMFGTSFESMRCQWPMGTLGSLSTAFSDGPFGSNLKSSHYRDSGIRVIRLQNVGVGSFIDDDAAYIPEEHFARLSKHTCRPGDVIIGTLGNPNLRAFVQPPEVPVALNKADCVQMRVDPAKVTAIYISALLNQPMTERMARSLMHGQTRTRISMGQLREMEVPVPPLQLQYEFETRIELLASQRSHQNESLTRLDTLFSSLQARAFSGEL